MHARLRGTHCASVVNDTSGTIAFSGRTQHAAADTASTNVAIRSYGNAGNAQWRIALDAPVPVASFHDRA